MKALIAFLIWCVLFVLAWPVAVAALILLPILWILSIPFRILVWAVEAILGFVKATFFLPARLLGYRNAS